MADIDETVLAELTTGIVTAFVAKNSVPPVDLPALIHSVHRALAGLKYGAARAPAGGKPVPPVPIKKSVTDDYIVSLETGGHFQSLKRHLSALGMTPAEYRRKWGLPPDYPMVAASYAAKRSTLAKRMGLGNIRKKA